jgi:hypothetical protein
MKSAIDQLITNSPSKIPDAKMQEMQHENNRTSHGRVSGGAESPPETKNV